MTYDTFLKNSKSHALWARMAREAEAAGEQELANTYWRNASKATLSTKLSFEYIGNIKGGI